MEFCYYFNNWFHFLATPSKAGLGYITPFTEFYYNKDKEKRYDENKAFYFLNEFQVNGEKVIFNWLTDFVEERGKFMDTPSPEARKAVDEWVNDPATHINDFEMPVGGYTTFNEFFTRQLRPGARPVAAVEDDSVIVAPADSELNMIDSVLTADEELDIKGHYNLNVQKLLNEYYTWNRFVGGTALSCVLLPANYHHFHAPVSGTLVHSELVHGIFFGLEDAPEWFHNGNVGASDADFNVFGEFQRRIFVFETNGFGQVAMVAVGLNTISGIGFEMSSVHAHGKFQAIDPENPPKVYKGEKLGYFRYGGSLNILLFEPGVFPGIEVHQGQRIGTLNQPSSG